MTTPGGGGSDGVLDASDLVVDFHQRNGTDLRAVDHVSLSLRAGQTVALVGESGSGKSTVVRALARLERLTSGTIRLRGQAIKAGRQDLASYRRSVQVVFQDPFASLNPAHSIGHHLSRPLLIHGRARRGKELHQAQVDLLRSVRLGPPEQLLDQFPHELSGGQRQRLAIARALAPQPSVLLADEPVSMLDVSIRLEILNLLDSLKADRNLALLYVTHDLATARHFSSEILVMYRGEVIERGPTDEVILQPAHPYTQVLALSAPSSRTRRSEDKPDLSHGRARSGQTPPSVTAGTGCRFRWRCPAAMPICAERHPVEVELKPAHVASCWLHADSENRAAKPFESGNTDDTVGAKR